MACDATLLDSIRAGLDRALGGSAATQWVRDLPGGDINRAGLVRRGEKHWFVKYHYGAPPGMFEAEADALSRIASTGTIRVPEPAAWGDDGHATWLALEHLDLGHRGDGALLGEQLAALHAVPQAGFGWNRDNYIGSTPQSNTPSEDWATFWRDRRLAPQLEMAASAGASRRLLEGGERLLADMEGLLDGHRPGPSLLHGDLWSGNKAYTSGGQPVIFDPASYCGDRETDIAMTELFGGFDTSFYAAYRAHAPLAAGYGLRRELYNLYHLLNHLNLFGTGYEARCEQVVATLLAEMR